MKNNKYPILPFISYGLLPGDNGLFISLPFKGISINDYRQLHHGFIAKERGHYKSVIDVIMISCVNKSYVNSFDVSGIHLKPNMFKSKVEIEWVLSFSTNLERDPSNYTQKIMLDAIVDVGILTNDSERYVFSDKCFFGNKDYNSITCILNGDINGNYFIKSTPVVKYDDLISGLGVDKKMEITK